VKDLTPILNGEWQDKYFYAIFDEEWVIKKSNISWEAMLL